MKLNSGLSYFNARLDRIILSIVIIAFEIVNVTTIGAEIVSTNHPKPYLLNEHIAYHIKITGEKRFYLDFLSFELQNPKQLNEWNDGDISCE